MATKIGFEEFPITKSASDKREYRGLILTDNQLKIVLISDPTADKAAASCTIGAGSLLNPPDFLGLAHFLEHMLFLGTTKYPEDSGFDKFLTTHGGSSNAYTDEDHTNYHFDVAPANLEEALDRFAYFFINPLLTPSATEREIQAVHSEYEENVPDDDWRFSGLQKATSSLSHPYHQFAIGNLQTLWTGPKEKNLDIIPALFTYHSSLYSANIMTLAVAGQENLDQLQSMVLPLFSQIQNKDIELQRWEMSPFGENEVGILIRAIPIKDLREMHIVFPIPDTTKSYKMGSDHYISHLIGHEGSGSLLSFYKGKNWVNALTIDISPLGRGFATCDVELELSKQGLEHFEDIVTVFFQYLALLRISGPQKWIWDELRDIQEMNFRFVDQKDAETTVTSLTPNMLLYPLKDVMSAEYLISGYNPTEIQELLSHLVPEKVRLTIIAKENKGKTNLIEPYFNISYAMDKIRSDLIEKWKNIDVNADLHLPIPNEFIPSDFELKTPRLEWGIIPRCVVDDKLSRVWFLQDNEYLMPKAVIQLEIFNHLAMRSPKDYALMAMMKKTIEDKLSEVNYNASVAGLSYNIGDSEHGLMVYVSGYSHKIGILLNKIFQEIVKHECTLARFEVLKEAYLRLLQSWDREQPRTHASWYVNYLLREKRWSPMEVLEVLPGVTFEDFKKFMEEYLSKVKLIWLVYGNLNETECKAIVAQITNLFEERGTEGISKDEEICTNELKLSEGVDFVFTTEHHHHSDSSVVVMFQGNEEGPRWNALIDLIDQMAFEGCYTQLRTKEQLGYCVWSGVRRAIGSPRGFEITVQSAFEPSYVVSRIDAYLENLYKSVQSMSEDEFIKHRNALAVRKRDKPKSLSCRAVILWLEITSRDIQFNRVEDELKALENLTHSETLTFFEEFVGPNGSKRRRLNVHIQSSCKPKKGKKQPKQPEIVSDREGIEIFERKPCPIVNILEWKKTLESFPAAGFNQFSFPNVEESKLEPDISTSEVLGTTLRG